MSVDLPRPDSPEQGDTPCQRVYEREVVTTTPTDDHGGELEALAHTLPVHLVRKVGKAHVAHELFADDGRGACLGGLGGRRAVHPSVAGEGVAVGGRDE